MHDQAVNGEGQAASAAPGATRRASPDAAMNAAVTRRGAGLSARLFSLTVLFVTVTEIFIYVPSVANFTRVTW